MVACRKRGPHESGLEPVCHLVWLEAQLRCEPQHGSCESPALHLCLSSSMVEGSCFYLGSEQLEDVSGQGDEQEAGKAFLPCVLANENQEPCNLGVQQCLVKMALQSCPGVRRAAWPLCWDSLGRWMMAAVAKAWRPGSSGLTRAVSGRFGNAQVGCLPLRVGNIRFGLCSK